MCIYIYSWIVYPPHKRVHIPAGGDQPKHFFTQQGFNSLRQTASHSWLPKMGVFPGMSEDVFPTTRMSMVLKVNRLFHPYISRL